jgi:hypothetical protein
MGAQFGQLTRIVTESASLFALIKFGYRIHNGERDDARNTNSFTQPPLPASGDETYSPVILRPSTRAGSY